MNNNTGRENPRQSANSAIPRTRDLHKPVSVAGPMPNPAPALEPTPSDHENSSAKASSNSQPAREPKRELSPAARRALQEAQERADARANTAKDNPNTEIGGRDGPEPTRYGDWEKNGIISDF